MARSSNLSMSSLSMQQRSGGGAQHQDALRGRNEQQYRQQVFEIAEFKPVGMLQIDYTLQGFVAATQFQFALVIDQVNRIVGRGELEVL